jgi:hypothetical protein
MSDSVTAGMIPNGWLPEARRKAREPVPQVAEVVGLRDRLAPVLAGQENSLDLGTEFP